MKINQTCRIFFILLFLITSGCISAPQEKKCNLPQQKSDFHVYEETAFPDSPFQNFVTNAFIDNTHHYLHVLDIGDDALLARIHLIRQAQKAIYIQSYIWSNDESGRLMVYELVEAAKRGVKVNIILDYLPNNLSTDLIAFFTTVSPNISIKFYNPNTKNILPLKLHYLKGLTQFKSLNQRMHNKIFIIDDRVAITGGRNHQNDYFDRGVNREFKDRDVIIIGPVVKKMTGSFGEYWDYPFSIPSQDMAMVKKFIDNGLYKIRENKSDYDLNDFFTNLESRADNIAYIEERFTEDLFKVNKIDFIVDQPGKNSRRSLSGGGEVVDALTEFLTEADERIIIQTPYLILGNKSRRFFKALRRKNPDIDILVSSNSLAAADHFYAYAFSYKRKKFYVKKLKWRIFEFKPRPEDESLMIDPLDNIAKNEKRFICIHAKTFIVDHDKIYIGSFNLDPRSANLNTEAGIIVHDEAFTRHVAGNILRDIAPANSWAIGRRPYVPLISHFSGLMDDL
ncbi:MAG: phospholipase D family protein, partial [Candidatus Omnitrophica bacterium]|nr:phospholipase D family protein [Candidatus Omnitrophota bacterium]